MRIGILALQGAFAEHSAILQKLGADSFEIRQKRDLAQPMDGLIIPGGESTVMGKLLKELDCYDEVRSRIENGLPVFGTCAGLILLAKEAEGGKVQLGTMDIVARRNAYGRQLGSFSTTAEMKGVGEVPMVFIRAPISLPFPAAQKFWQKWTARSWQPERAASWLRRSIRN